MTPRATRAAATILILSLACYAMVLRICVAWDLPLWLDESWTAQLSAAPTFADWMRQDWLEINGSFYYLLLWLWPFESNFGLKLPSLLFLAAAALIAIRWRPASVTREQAMFWAALLILWPPGLSLFVDARYYALLFLLSTAQTIAFIRLLEQPGRVRACWWTGLSTLAILSHYYAALPALLQGLILLWSLRARVWRLWPAALLTIPAFGELAWHWPRLHQYASDSWPKPLRADEILGYLTWPIAGVPIGTALVLALVIAFRRQTARPIQHAVLAAFVSLLVLVLLGTVRPMLVDRYLLPVVPAMLLAVATASRPIAWLPIAVTMCLFIDRPASFRAWMHNRAWFGLEVPVRLVPKSARTVTWILTHKGSDAADPSVMRGLLADALARNGRTAEARWGHIPSDATIIISETATPIGKCFEHPGTFKTLVCTPR